MSRIRLTVEVEVIDEAELRKFANKSYKDAWGWPFEQHNLDKPMTLPTAVLEAVVLSNQNPAPSEYGIEITEYEAVEID